MTLLSSFRRDSVLGTSVTMDARSGPSFPLHYPCDVYVSICFPYLRQGAERAVWAACLLYTSDAADDTPC
eukprot:3659182-Pyramimonas_sp.AAC.2